jgi:hypothetical protein
LKDAGIERRLREDAEALARAVDAIDVAEFTRRVLASLDASASVDAGASAVPGRPSGVAGHQPGSLAAAEADDGDLLREGQQREEIARELDACAAAARGGDAAAARRVAELLELAECDDQAAAWWRHAAMLGDPDAIDYVQEVLGQDPYPSTKNHEEGANGTTTVDILFSTMDVLITSHHHTGVNISDAASGGMPAACREAFRRGKGENDQDG